MPTAALHRQTLSDLLRRTAARWPHKTALVCGDLRWTWAQFQAEVDALAAGVNPDAIKRLTAALAQRKVIAKQEKAGK